MKKISLTLVILTVFLTTGFSESKKFTFSSDRTSITMTKGKNKTVLTGKAHIVSDTTDIRADTIELFGPDFRYAECSGNVTAIDTRQGIKITTENLFYDRDNKRLIIRGYAQMVDQKNEMVVKGGYFENLSDEKITLIQIGVRILKASKDSTLTARSEFARYDRSKNTLELSGMPVVYKDGDEFHSTRITINLDTDEIKLTGKVSGTITSSDTTQSESP